jgi:hypothetical protein
VTNTASFTCDNFAGYSSNASFKFVDLQRIFMPLIRRP